MSCLNQEFNIDKYQISRKLCNISNYRNITISIISSITEFHINNNNEIYVLNMYTPRDLRELLHNRKFMNQIYKIEFLKDDFILLIDTLIKF